MEKKTTKGISRSNLEKEKKTYLPEMPKIFKRAVLASIGALSISREESIKAYAKFVKEGRLVQEKWIDKIKKLFSRKS